MNNEIFFMTTLLHCVFRCRMIQTFSKSKSSGQYKFDHKPTLHTDIGYCLSRKKWLDIIVIVKLWMHTAFIFIDNSFKTMLCAVGTMEKTFIDVKLWSLLVISINVSEDKWTLRGFNHKTAITLWRYAHPRLWNVVIMSVRVLLLINRAA